MVVTVDVYDPWKSRAIVVGHEVALKTDIWASISVQPTSSASKRDEFDSAAVSLSDNLSNAPSNDKGE